MAADWKLGGHNFQVGSRLTGILQVVGWSLVEWLAGNWLESGLRLCLEAGSRLAGNGWRLAGRWQEAGWEADWQLAGGWMEAGRRLVEWLAGGWLEVC